VRRNLVEPLKDSGRGVSGGFRRGRLRNALVVFELALSLLLLTGAGLLMRTLVALQTPTWDFNPANLLVARLPFPNGQFKTAAEKQRFFTRCCPVCRRSTVCWRRRRSTRCRLWRARGDIESRKTTPSNAGHVHPGQRGLSSCPRCAAPARPRAPGYRDRGRTQGALVKPDPGAKYFGNEIPRPPDPLEDARGQPRISHAQRDFRDRRRGFRHQEQWHPRPVLPEAMLPYTVTGIFGRGILVRTAGPRCRSSTACTARSGP